MKNVKWSFVLLLIVMAVVSGVSLSCSNDEYDEPMGLKTMARRKMGETPEPNENPGNENDPINYASYMQIPVHVNECALWSLTKLKIMRGGAFSEEYPVSVYYSRLRSKAKKLGYTYNTKMPSSMVLQIGTEEGLLNEKVTFGNTAKKGEEVKSRIESKRPKLVGFTDHIGVFDSKDDSQLSYLDASGGHDASYSDVLELFY